MAKIGWVEQLLLRWAEVVTSGSDGSGYPTKNVLDPTWSPPAPGQLPTLKTAVSRGGVRRTHEAVAQLSMRGRNTLVVHYCLRLPIAEQAARLECSERTVHARVEAAHQALAALLSG